MALKTLAVIICLVIVVPAVSASTEPLQEAGPLVNKDVIDMKSAGISDEVILLKIRSGPTKFSTEASDLIALKNAGLSDAVIAAMLKTGTSGSGEPINLSKGALVVRFGSSVDHADAAGLPEAAQAAVVNALRVSKLFSGVATPEQAGGQKPLVEISAELVDFAPGNTAKRLLIGFGTGRANASFNFVVKESATGKVLWKKTIKETSSFWMSGTSSSSSQRSELPENVAKELAEELQKAKLPILR